MRKLLHDHAGLLAVLKWIPVGLFLTEHVVSLATIDGRSMQPTFNPDSSALRRDVVLLDRCSLPCGFPLERGQVVTLRSPTNGNLTVKRVIALEGDIIRTRELHSKKTVHVPIGHCWVEGDEAFHSRDSNTFGPVSTALIDARVIYIIWPWWRIGAPAPGLLHTKRRLQFTAWTPKPEQQVINVDE